MNKNVLSAFLLLATGAVISGQTTPSDSTKLKSLEEVVIVGYKTQKRGNTSESFSTVKKEDLKSVTTPDVANMIQGRASGVRVSPSSGAPGSVAAITVRGITSISGGVNPIWVVDGVIFPNQPFIDPNQIESINILKDAASTALYGARGASGVIQVITKGGKKGPGKIIASASTSMNFFNLGNFKLMNGAEMYDFYANVLKSDEDFTPALKDRSFDWIKNGTQVGIVQNHTLEFSGGTDRSQTYISGNYYNEKGTVKGSNLDRMSFRLNQIYQINDKLVLKPKVSVVYNNEENREHSLYQMYLNMPWDNPYLEDGKPGDPRGNYPTSGPDKWWGRDQSNYLYDLQWNYGKSSNLNLALNGDFDYDFTKNLKFSSINNYTLYYDDSSDYTDPLSISGTDTSGAIYKYNSKRISRYFNQMLKYKFSVREHNFNALAAYEYNDSSVESANTSVYNIVGGKEVLNAGASSGTKPSGTASEYAYQGYLFNANYDYAGRYLAQFSLRRDGASIFGPDVRYGTFYSVSGAWNMHNESFLKYNWLTQLKLRASYGTVGNTPAGIYGWADNYGINYRYNGNPGAVWEQLENKDYTWETVKTTNLGLDMRVFNRLGLSLDYYIKDNHNLSFVYYYPVLAGNVYQYQNVGDVRNKGFEASLTYDIIKRNKVKWSFDFNIGANKNRVIALKDGKPIPNGNKRIIEGEDLNTWYMRKWMGVDSQTGKPQWEVVKDDGSSSITNNYNTATLQKVGTATPDFFGGFNTHFEVSDFFVDVFGVFSKGGLIYNSPRELFDSDGAYPTYNQMSLGAQGWNRWMNPGDNATHPAAIYNNTSLSNKPSSRYLEDASYLKIRSIKLGYNFQRELLQSLHLSNASIFINGENMFTFTKFSFVDPEVGHSGQADAAQYPIPKRVTLGLSLTF